MASCVGCKFLYGHDSGYSNYTWMETYVHCAKDRNPNLLDGEKEEPYDWNKQEIGDNWKATADSRCELFAAGPFITLDVDGENGPADDTDDQEAIDAICKHSGREPKGRE